jgi:antitoxin HicB
MAMKTKQLGYTVFFKKDGDEGYIASVPMLPGCFSYGANLEEANAMIADAISAYIQSLRKHDEEIPTEEETFYSKVFVDQVCYPAAYA